MKHLISNTANTAFVEVYEFKGTSSLQSAMNAIVQHLNGYGGRVQYKSTGQSNTGYTIVTGSTSFDNTQIIWSGGFKAVGGSIVGIITGANASQGSKYNATVTNILYSLR